MHAIYDGIGGMYMNGISLALGVSLSLASSLAIAQPCQPAIEYDEIVAAVTENFFDRDFNGLDWSARVSHYRETIECGYSAEEVASSINELLAELDASHTELYTASDIHYWGLNAFFSRNFDEYQIEFSGIWPERIEDRWHAQHILQGSPAEEAGVLPGDELVALNGEEFRPDGFESGPSILDVSSDAMTTRSVLVRTVRKNLLQGFTEASAASMQILSAGEHRVGYYRLWTAHDLILESMNEAFTTFEGERVDALIVDFRGGYGGTSEAYLERIRDSEYLGSIPKYFLIDDSVRSGKEMLSAIIRRDGLGTLVGATTSGSFLGASPFRFFDDKYLLLLAVGGSRDGDPYSIEGVGVDPDVTVRPCKTYCGDTDPVLEAALSLVTP